MADGRTPEPTFTRAQPPQVLSDDVQSFLGTTKFYREGRPLNIHQVLSNHPRAAQALNRFLDWGDEAVLSSRERRLLILRTSVLTGCQYEWDIHSQQGVRSGDIKADELDFLQSPQVDDPSLSERDQALLTVTDSVCRTNTMSDREWDSVRVILTTQDIIEALIVVGNYRLCAGLINSLAIPLEGDLGDGSPDGPLADQAFETEVKR
jgi:alkylhydroperoxidase family enzyme